MHTLLKMLLLATVGLGWIALQVGHT